MYYFFVMQTVDSILLWSGTLGTYSLLCVLDSLSLDYRMHCYQIKWSTNILVLEKVDRYQEGHP
jgi:hypothetical protein